MSKLIKIIECRNCGAELYRKEEGEYFNPNGTLSSNTQVFIVDEKNCSFCTGIPTEVKINESVL